MQGTRCHLSPSYNLLNAFITITKPRRALIKLSVYVVTARINGDKLENKSFDVFYCIYAEIQIPKLPQKYCWPSMNLGQSSCLFSFTPALGNQPRPRICGREFPPGKETTLVQVTYWVMTYLANQRVRLIHILKHSIY